jgi:hypothetical protein
MSAAATSVLAAVGPWGVLVVAVLLLALVLGVVGMVLKKSLSRARGRDVSVTVRIALLLRIQIDVKAPRDDVASKPSLVTDHQPPQLRPVDNPESITANQLDLDEDQLHPPWPQYFAPLRARDILRAAQQVA